MKILMIGKYPPIQGGVSAEFYWLSQLLVELGHEVKVITNAFEVEDEYRIRLDEEDKKLLTGYHHPGTIELCSSTLDERHAYIPQNNPSVSKLTSLALTTCKKWRPDFIWSHYLEPFGVVGLLVSKLTGIPFVIKHAGSDIGRLMETDQLRPIYEEVFLKASFVVTSKTHHEKFVSMGVGIEKLVPFASVKLRPELFYSTPMPSPGGEMVLGIYGKTGKPKGTPQLIEAMSHLNREEFPCLVKACWGGRNINTYLASIKERCLESVIEVRQYVPHWRIPEFIRSCDLILFLENNFSISFHGPSVPLEVLACGRPILTTKEMFLKPQYRSFLKEGINCVLVDEPFSAESLVIAIKEAATFLKKGPTNKDDLFDVGVLHVHNRMVIEETIKKISLAVVTGR